MATYAAKSGTQNFTDTWAEVYLSSNTEYWYVADSPVNENTADVYQVSPAFTPGAMEIDAIGFHFNYSRSAAYVNETGGFYGQPNWPSDPGTFTLRLAQGGSTVAGTEVTVNGADLMEVSRTIGFYGAFGGELQTRYDGSFVMIKLPTPVTLNAGTAYTLDFKASRAHMFWVYTSHPNSTSWMFFFRKISTGTPVAGDRLFICGELSPTSGWSTNTVLHNSTDSTTTFGRLDIGNSGVWQWGTASSTNYYYKTNGDIRVGSSGTLQIGTSASPLPATSTATIDFVPSSGGACALFCSRKSNVTMIGPVKTHVGYLQSNIAVGATTATISSSSSGPVDPEWKNGDLVVFAAAPTDTNLSSHWNKFDQATLSSDSNGAGGIQLTGGTTHAHKTQHPWVANLSRNIKIKGTSTSNTYIFASNTDKINLRGVEMFNLDSCMLRNGDMANFVTIENCVVRHCRAVDYTKPPGIISWSNKNLLLKDCVVARAGGYAFTRNVSSGNVNSDGTGQATVVKNCVSIANDNSHNQIQGFENSSQLGNDPYVILDGCISTSNSSSGIYWRSASTTLHNNMNAIKNCFVGVNAGISRFLGEYEGWGDVITGGEGEGSYKVTNCSFVDTHISLEGCNVTVENCAFTHSYDGTGSFVNSNQLLRQHGYINEPKLPNYLNNCTFTVPTSGAVHPFADFNHGGQPVIINGGSTNCGLRTDIGANGGAQWLFNNFACPNWATSFLSTNNATTNHSPLNVIGGPWNRPRDGWIKFQRFNQVEGDHRTYSGQYMMFADSTIFDSSPRSLKIYSNAINVGSWGAPIRIPLKKNQSATLEFKVKLSENTAEIYDFYKPRKSFMGLIPSVFIKANPALGPNYNSDIELVNAEQINGATTFTPSALGTAVRLWLDCTDASTLSYNPETLTVHEWRDKSGNAHHLTQTVELQKPFLRKNNPTGCPFLATTPVSWTSRADQRLAFSGNILNTTTAEMEIFMVAVYTTGNNGTLMRFNGSAGFMDVRVVGFYNNQITSGIGEAPPWLPSVLEQGNNEGFARYGIHIQHLRNSMTNNQRRLLTNGSRRGSATSGLQDATPVNITPNSNFLLGSAESTSIRRSSSSIDIYELIIVGRRMTDAEVANMNKYLANKYKIALRHDTTTWQTISHTIPAPTDDCVIEALLKVRGTGEGFINVDTFKVT